MIKEKNKTVQALEETEETLTHGQFLMDSIFLKSSIKVELGLTASSSSQTKALNHQYLEELEEMDHLNMFYQQVQDLMVFMVSMISM